VEPGPAEWCNEPSTSPDGLPHIDGVASYEGFGRRCGSFEAPFRFRETKPGIGYDRFVLRGDQVNRPVPDAPFAWLDRSDVFDELHLIVPGPGAHEAQGVVFGGPRGMLPRTPKLTNRLLRLIRDAQGESAGSVADRILEDVRDGRAPRKLARQLDIGQDGCAYELSLDFAGIDDELDLLLDQLSEAIPLDPIETRFDVDPQGTDGAPEPLAPVVGSETTGPFEAFFDNTFVATIIDGCRFNDHFWVFAAGLTAVELEITVTDTSTGLASAYSPPGGLVEPAPPIMDTAAFATYP
jgi:hypothetical protein